MEEDRPEHGNVLQPEDIDLAELVLGRQVGEAEVVAEVRRQAEAAREDRQREPRDDLARPQRDDQEGVDGRDDEPGECGGQDRQEQHERRRPRRPLHRPEPHHRAHQHHPLDPQVEYPGSLGQQLPQRGEEDRRAVGNRLREDGDHQGVIDAHGDGSAAGAASTGARARLPKRTR